MILGQGNVFGFVPGIVIIVGLDEMLNKELQYTSNDYDIIVGIGCWEPRNIRRKVCERPLCSQDRRWVGGIRQCFISGVVQ